eukprot:1385287-Amphidinium_carterae.1
MAEAGMVPCRHRGWNGPPGLMDVGGPSCPTTPSILNNLCASTPETLESGHLKGFNTNTSKPNLG